MYVRKLNKAKRFFEKSHILSGFEKDCILMEIENVQI